MTKNLTFLLFCLLFTISFTSKAQSYFQGIPENEQVTQNGFVVEYRIMNHQTRDVGKKRAHERYEVRITVVNQNSAANYVFTEFRQGKTSLKAPVIVEASCRNATGARLTAKTSEFSPKVRYINYKRKRNNGSDDEEANWETINVPTGFFWDLGEMQESNVIFIVPEGEKADIEFRVNQIQVR
jgi:hypothetical protein